MTLVIYQVPKGGKTVVIKDNPNKFLAKCKAGDHELTVIYRGNGNEFCKPVVRWCKLCGSVAVDVDHDGSRVPEKLMKTRSPLVVSAFENNCKGKTMRIEARSEVPTSREPSRIIVYDGDQVIAEIVAKVEFKPGADGGQYPCVTLEQR